MANTLGLWYGQTQLYGVRISRVRQRAVYNGPDYLWTEKEIYGTGYLNSTTTNFSTALEQGQDLNAVDFNRAYINQIQNPRQRLRIGQLVSDTDDSGLYDSVSPADDITVGDAVDCQTGPTPIYFDLVSCNGTRTVMVEFGFRWHVVEVSETGDPPPIISNRWDQTHDYPVDQRLVVTTTGRAIFRRDALLKNGTLADDYRGWLLVPVLDGFARTMRVSQAQDGLTITYNLTDRQQTYDAVDAQIIHMDVKATVISARPNQFDQGFKAADWALGQAANFNAGLQASAERAARILVRAHPTHIAENLARPDPQAAADLAGAPFGLAGNIIGGLQFASGAIQMGFSFLPRTTVRIDVSILGTPQSNMQDLLTVALDVMAAKTKNVRATGAGWEVMVSADYGNRILLASRVYDISPVAGLWNGPPAGFFNANAADISTGTVAGVIGYSNATTNNFGEAIPGVYEFAVSKGPGQGGDLLGITSPNPIINLVAAALQPPLADPSQEQTPPPEAPALDDPDSLPEDDHLTEPE